MPKWNEYKELARSRGSLAFELYVVESSPIVAPEEMMKKLPEHMAYQGQMESEGKLFMAGPTSDPSGEEMIGVGLIVYRAANMVEARAIADNDPMHKGGI
ncbi:MAG: YciI family protein, partial [Nitratireductor sp.]